MAIYKQIFAFLVNLLKVIKRFFYIIIIVALIIFNVLTLASAAFYSAAYGLLSSLPAISLSVDSMQNRNKKLQKKIKKSQKIVKKQRKLMPKKAAKGIVKKAGSALIPFAGSAIVAGIGAQEYCEKLKDNIDLHNALNDTTEKFDYGKCYDEAKKDIGDFWK